MAANSVGRIPVAEMVATLTVEMYRLPDDPAAPRWKYEARLVDGLGDPWPPVLASGKGPTFDEAIRCMAQRLPRA